MNIWTIKLETLADFTNLTNVLVRSDLIPLKSAKIITIEVNESRNCPKCSKSCNYKFNLAYQSKKFTLYFCYFCIVEAIENYFTKLFDFIELQSTELKQDNIHFKQRIKTKRQLIKICNDKDIDWKAYYDETISFQENLAHFEPLILLDEYKTI